MLKRDQPVKRTIRAFVRPVPGLSAERQQQAAGDAAIFYSADERDAWVRSLGPGQVGWVWRLSLLAVESGGEDRPSTDFIVLWSELARRVQAGATLIEGETKTSSDDWPAMLKALKRASDQVAAGRRLTSLEARRRGEVGAQKAIERSAASVLKRPEIAPHVNAIRAIWRSAEYGNRDEAADAVNAYMRERALPPIGSAATLFRVFGGRGLRKDAKRPDRQSWVYFVRQGASKRVKIGRAVNVDKRMNKLRHPLLGALKLMAKVPGGDVEEKALHKRFAEYRINGEWFRLEGALAEYVAELRKAK